MLNSGSLVQNTNTPSGKNMNVGGQNYDTNFKSDLLVSPQLSSMAQHSLQNSLTHNQQELNQLSKQWGHEAQRVNDLSNTLSNNNQSGSSIGAEDFRNLQRIHDLGTNIQAGLGRGKLVSLGGNINSNLQETLQHSLNEYDKLSHDLSQSSNTSIADAFKNSNSFVSSTQHQVAETVSTAQTLSDLRSASSSISANLINEFDSYIRNLGYNPTELNYQQQMQLAEKFMGSGNSANGIAKILYNPFSHLARISGIEPNSNGLNKPATDGTFISQLNNKQANINSQIEDFKENPGNQIGEQLLEQTKTAGKIAKNIADPYIDLFENK